MPLLNQPQLFITPPACTVQELLTEGQQLILLDPKIVTAIDDDRDKWALAAKVERLKNAEWEEIQAGQLFVTETEGALGKRVPFQLAAKGGRPRIPATIVLMGVLIRGRYGSLTAADVRDRLQDSTAFAALLWQHGLSHVDPTALARHVNNLSDETIERIFKLQLSRFIMEGLDDFDIFSADSTSVRANAQWPNDSSLIFKLLRRATAILCRFVEQGWCRTKTKQIEKWLTALKGLAKEIDLQAGKTNADATRKRLYAELVGVARKLAIRLGRQWDHAEAAVMKVNLNATNSRLRQDAIDDFSRCVADALHLIDYAEERTQRNPAAEREEHEKITGIVEQDAVLIYKGGRQPNFGYKVQAAFSGNGIVTALIVDKGNTSDSESLLPLLRAAKSHTGIAPKIGTVDDGYSSKANFDIATKAHGLEVMSISGAKGRAAVGEDLYASEPYKEARRIRGKLEFPFFCLKYIHEMDRMKRSGLRDVRREITEKAIAYNVIRLIQLRKHRAAAERLAA